MADLQLPLLVDLEVHLEKLAEFPQPLFHEEQCLRGSSPVRGELMNARTKVTDLAHLVHMTLVVNRVQAEQVGRHVCPIAHTAAVAATQPRTRSPIDENRMRLRHDLHKEE